LSCGARLERASSTGRETRLESYLPKGMLAKLEAARAGRSMRGERRIVTMLFCDVVGSTAMAEKLDPEEWTEIMNGAYENLIAGIGATLVQAPGPTCARKDEGDDYRDLLQAVDGA
jgi:class 3 adenylate cyclase